MGLITKLVENHYYEQPTRAYGQNIELLYKRGFVIVNLQAW